MLWKIPPEVQIILRLEQELWEVFENNWNVCDSGNVFGHVCSHVLGQIYGGDIGLGLGSGPGLDGKSGCGGVGGRSFRLFHSNGDFVTDFGPSLGRGGKSDHDGVDDWSLRLFYSDGGFSTELGHSSESDDNFGLLYHIFL